VTVLWAVSFAFVEASVVEYLRALYHPIESGGFQFPLPTLEQIQALGKTHERRLLIELGRELCTLVMLAATAALAGRNRREGWSFFLIAFGVWDIFYYVWLKVFIGWPESLWTWDLLFLIPVPWVSPVAAPTLVSIVMIASGLVALHYESAGIPIALNYRDWAVISFGGVTVIVSFCIDCPNVMAGGLPNPFNWPLFFAGLGASSIAFALVVLRNVRRSYGNGAAQQARNAGAR
jgi:hypothetical protein